MTSMMSAAHGMGFVTPNQSALARKALKMKRIGSARLSDALAEKLHQLLRPWSRCRGRIMKLARLIWRWHRHSDKPFPMDRRALAKLFSVKEEDLTEKMLRTYTGILCATGFMRRLTGGKFNPGKGRCEVVLYNLTAHELELPVSKGPQRALPGPLSNSSRVNAVAKEPMPEDERLRIEAMLRAFKLDAPSPEQDWLPRRGRGDPLS